MSAARAFDLDDLGAIEGADPGGMLAAVEGAPAQWSLAIERARAAKGLPSADGVEHVVVCGMGGSGIAGDVLAAAAAPRLAVPVAVVKGYELPAFVGTRSLVFCVSYSGNTEETLAAFEEARARRARIVAVTTGGALAERAREAGVPAVSPLAGLQPRAALASLSVPPIVVLERMGLLPDQSADLAEAESVLAEGVGTLGRAMPLESNPAKRIARALEGLVPLVWGQEGPLAVAALRWRCQLNENAKVPAFSSVLPELDHNEVVGYDPGLPALERVALVVLRTSGEHPRVARRVGISLALVRDRVAHVEEVRAGGSSVLARLASAAIIGDFVSVYIALARGVDPTPVRVIDRLKAELA